MAYFSDLSFSTSDSHPAINVGWLQRGHEFETIPPSEETLDLLWSFCAVKVMPARGIHQCDLCATPQTVYADRNGDRRLLGAAEIRAFSGGSSASALARRLGQMGSGLVLLRSSALPCMVFAAPNLIYHYVQTHHYKPPDEFLRALKEGPQPPSQEYFDLLSAFDPDWSKG
jgi:hypothetical protein